MSRSLDQLLLEVKSGFRVGIQLIITGTEYHQLPVRYRSCSYPKWRYSCYTSTGCWCPLCSTSFFALSRLCNNSLLSAAAGHGTVTSSRMHKLNCLICMLHLTWFFFCNNDQLNDATSKMIAILGNARVHICQYLINNFPQNCILYHGYGDILGTDLFNREYKAPPGEWIQYWVYNNKSIYWRNG